MLTKNAAHKSYKSILYKKTMETSELKPKSMNKCSYLSQKKLHEPLASSNAPKPPIFQTQPLSSKQNRDIPGDSVNTPHHHALHTKASQNVSPNSSIHHMETVMSSHLFAKSNSGCNSARSGRNRNNQLYKTKTLGNLQESFLLTSQDSRVGDNKENKKKKQGKDRPLTQIQLQNSSISKYLNGASSISNNFTMSQQYKKGHLTSMCSQKTLKTSLVKGHQRNQMLVSQSHLRLFSQNSRKDETRDFS